MRLLPLLIAAMTLAGTIPLAAGPNGGMAKVEGYERAGKWDQVSFSTPKPSYPYDVRKDSGELIMVVRLFVAKSGQVERVTALGFWGDERLVPHVLRFAQANWRVNGQPPRAFFQDIPVAFQISEASSWATPLWSTFPEDNQARCAAVLKYAQDQRRRTGRKGPPRASQWWEEYAR